MPSTWETYGVDANGDGVARPLQPRRRDLRRRQLPQRGGHAGRHLQRDLRLQPRRLVRRRGPRQRRLLRPLGRRRRRSASPSPRSCRSSAASRPRPGATKSPHDYMAAFEDAAARYELGQRGVWALAAVARLESNFGRGMGKRSCASAARSGSNRASGAVRGRRRRRRPHPPRRPGRLGGDPGPPDLVAGQPPRRHLHPQPGRVVRAGGPRRRRRARRPLQGQLRRLARRAARLRLRNRRPTAPSSTTASPAPRTTPRRRSRRRSPPPTRSPPPPTSGAAATAPGTPPATTAPARSASPSTAPACSTPRSPRARWRATANAGPGRWITIYANPTHTYMEIAGCARTPPATLRYRAPLASEPPYPEGFVVRHPAGTRRRRRNRGPA